LPFACRLSGAPRVRSKLALLRTMMAISITAICQPRIADRHRDASDAAPLSFVCACRSRRCHSFSSLGLLIAARGGIRTGNYGAVPTPWRPLSELVRVTGE
jgi:hypothetical protein